MRLVRHLAAVDLDGPREVKRHAHAVALDGDDAHDTQRRRRVTDHDFFTFTTSDHKHRGTSCPGLSDPSATWLTGSDYPRIGGCESIPPSFAQTGPAAVGL
jgi:hypothetical protein